MREEGKEGERKARRWRKKRPRHQQNSQRSTVKVKLNVQEYTAHLSRELLEEQVAGEPVSYCITLHAALPSLDILQSNVG